MSGIERREGKIGAVHATIAEPVNVWLDDIGPANFAISVSFFQF